LLLAFVQAAAPFAASSAATPQVKVVSISPAVIGPGQSTTVTWNADKNGSYSVRVGGSGCGSGTLVSSGSYAAPSNLTTKVGVAALVEGLNTVRICLTAGSKTGSATGTVTRDTTAPKLTGALSSNDPVPTTAYPGESVTVSVVANEPLSKLAVNCGSAAVSMSPSDSTHWKGTFAVTTSTPLGPLQCSAVGTDSVGNSNSPTAITGVSVLAAAPTVSISSHPAASTTATDASFSWTTSGQVDQTTCTLDAVATSCTSPQTYTGLGLGSHTFMVTVSNTSGSNSDSYNWTISQATIGDTVTEIHYSFGNTPDSVVFDWVGQEQEIDYGPTTAYGQTAFASPSPVTPVDSPGPFRQVKLTGLQPSATYHYRIGPTGSDHTFQTIPDGDFTWADIGDTAATSCDPWIAQNQALIASQNPTFVTHGGDLSYANECGVAAVHQVYVDQQVWSVSAAFEPVWGNHEYGYPASNEATGQSPPAGTPRDTLENYKGRSFITNGQAVPSDTASQIQNPGCGWATSASTNTCQGNDWGWFQTGHVLFISYPEPWPNAYPAWQTNVDGLMATAQADPNIDFIITYGHRPTYSSITTSVDLNLQTAVNALAAKYSPSASNPGGKYVLNVDHHMHWEEAFAPIDGLVNITNGGGGAGQVSPTTFDSNSVFHISHPGVLSAKYSAALHSLTVNLLCGATFSPNLKANCTYGSTLYTATFTRPSIPAAAPTSLRSK
jgi:hypothetical protein